MPETNDAKKKLARTVNGVLKEFNFAVGGGFVLELHSLTSRESRDQDWFASLEDIIHSNEIWGYEFPHFGVLADRLIDALESDGYAVGAIRRSRLFAKLVITNPEGVAMECDLTAHRRREIPVMIDGIAVIGESDAIYGKFKVLCDRAAARASLNLPILRAAISAGADVLLTGDKDFLEPGLDNPRIMTAADFHE